MKKAITLPQFVKNFPKDKCFVKEEFSRPNDVNFDYSKDLSYEQKIKYVGWNYKFSTRLSVTDNCVYFVHSYKRLARRGKTFYPVESERQSIYIGKNEISFHRAAETQVLEFLSILGISWFKDIDSNILRILFNNKTIFRRVITNRIYNEETLYKSAAICIHGLKKVSWKTIRKYYQFIYGSKNFLFNRFFSLNDLYYFTKNIDQSVDIIQTFSEIDDNIYSDLLQSAIKLNETVDFTWSRKRIAEEHKRQTETLLTKELNAKKEIPIYDTLSMHFPFKLLNTEKDIFIEGSTMHHCLYNCYYNKINAHDYIAFHLNDPEECTLGIWLCNGKPALNQIYKKYDQPVSQETRQYAEDFINSHQEELMKLFDQKEKDGVSSSTLDLPIW